MIECNMKQLLYITDRSNIKLIIFNLCNTI